jgi:hypothetical protein
MAAPLKATFFAFKRRDRGGVLTSITAVHAVLALALFVAFVAANFGYIAAVAAGEDPEEVGSELEATLFVVSFVLGAMAYYVVTASYEAACLKWMIRGETSGFRGFSLGLDTWRVYGGQWIWFAVFVVLTIVASVLLAMFGAQPRLGLQAYPALTAFAGWAVVVAPLALRLAPGNAASVARRRFAYFDGMRVTQGRSLALFGSFFIVWLIWALLFAAIWLGSWFFTYLALGGDETELESADVNLGVLSCFSLGLFIANMALAFLSAGINARAVIAAAENGKLEGVLTDVAAVFE